MPSVSCSVTPICASNPSSPTASRVGYERHLCRHHILSLVTESQPDAELDDLIRRVRAQQMPPSWQGDSLPSKPAVTEMLVDETDAHRPQYFGQKVSEAEVCNAEGWYWSRQQPSGEIPLSVWCSRPRGHMGPHQARSGLSLHRHKVKVVQWDA